MGVRNKKKHLAVEETTRQRIEQERKLFSRDSYSFPDYIKILLQSKITLDESAREKGMEGEGKGKKGRERDKEGGKVVEE